MTWKTLLNLPTQTHRRHIRRFLRLNITDEQDVALRAFTAFRIWHQKLLQHNGSDRRSEDVGE